MHTGWRKSLSIASLLSSDTSFETEDELYLGMLSITLLALRNQVVGTECEAWQVL